MALHNGRWASGFTERWEMTLENPLLGEGAKGVGLRSRSESCGTCDMDMPFPQY